MPRTNLICCVVRVKSGGGMTALLRNVPNLLGNIVVVIAAKAIVSFS